MFVIDEWVLLGKNLTFWYSVSTWGAWRTAMEPVLEGCGRGDRRWAKHSACTTGKTQEKFLLLPLLFLIIDMLTLLSFLRSSCWDWLVISPPNRMLLNAAAFWNRISSSLKKKKVVDHKASFMIHLASTSMQTILTYFPSLSLPFILIHGQEAKGYFSAAKSEENRFVHGITGVEE